MSDPGYTYDAEGMTHAPDASPVDRRRIPWVPYEHTSLRTVTLCEETGEKVNNQAVCPVHGGDACMYVYRHPYDNAVDGWKKAEAWGEPDEEIS